MTKDKFVEFLNSFQKDLIFNNNASQYEIGYRCATGCVNDVVDTHCNLFINFTQNTSKSSLFEEDCINTIICVLESTLDNKTNDDDFNKGYKEKIKETIEKLKEYNKK